MPHDLDSQTSAPPWTRGIRLRATRLAPVMVSLPMIACSTSFGLVGSRTVAEHQATYAGVGTSVLAELPLLDTEANVAIGMESRLLQRVSESGTAWGDWRLSALLGLSQMPRGHEKFALGYEAFVAAGLARYQLGGQPTVAAAVGLTLGAPIRLSRRIPTWRADQLVGVQTYLVPAIGIGSLGLKQAEVSFGLHARVNLWSAILP